MSYWLIERQIPYHTEWWVGNHRISNANGGEWTTDASKAQHLTEWGATHHAEELMRWGIAGQIYATEHIDCDGPPEEGVT